MAINDERRIRCSFCGKHQDQVKRMIAGPGVYICDECVGLCMEAMGVDSFQQEDSEPFMGEIPDAIPTPKEIHAVLDQYIIGQEKAKMPCPWRCTTTISASISVGRRMWSCRRATFF